MDTKIRRIWQYTCFSAEKNEQCRNRAATKTQKSTEADFTACPHIIKTKQILYDNIGVYFVRIGEYDLAENYYLKAINFGNVTLKFAMANEHIVRICCYRSMHLKAYNYSLQAIKVYEECNINNRLSNCNLILGNVCMYVKEYQEAIRVFKKGVELNDRNSLNCLNKLFLFYIETYDVDNIYEFLKSIEDKFQHKFVYNRFLFV